MQVDTHSLHYGFCPGKATWSFDVAELYVACRLAMESGAMPEPGGFHDQDAHFAMAFPAFVDRWRERQYLRVWRDVTTFTQSVLKSVFGEKK